MHTDDTQAFNLWWVGNPGAMTYLLTCMIEHSSLSKFTLLGMLGAASVVFTAMDWGALRVKQMFAAEVRRLETQSDDETVQAAVSCLLTDFPEIRELWQSFSCHVPILDASWGALLKDWQHGVEKKGLLLLLLLQGWKVTDSAFWNGWCWRYTWAISIQLNPAVTADPPNNFTEMAIYDCDSVTQLFYLEQFGYNQRGRSSMFEGDLFWSVLE